MEPDLSNFGEEFQFEDKETGQDEPIGFKNSSQSLPQNLFEALGAYPPIPQKYYNTYPAYQTYYDQPDHALYNNDDYCNQVDLYNLNHPENMLEHMNFFTDYFYDQGFGKFYELIFTFIEIARSVIKNAANDTMPQISLSMNRADYLSVRNFKKDPEPKLFFVRENTIYRNKLQISLPRELICNYIIR